MSSIKDCYVGKGGGCLGKRLLGKVFISQSWSLSHL